MGFLIFLPVIMAIIGIAIAFICFIGICLVIMGVTGIAMNKILLRQIEIKKSAVKPLFNIISIIIGIIFILSPIGYVLYNCI